jgi:multiple sugar transport system permease protein
MLNSETGWFNRFLDLFGIDGPNWIDSVTWIYPALVIISLWGLGNAYLITLAGMQSVPTELYESATVDGAGAWSRFRNITLPMISPVIFYNLILTVVGLFRYFEIPFILKGTTGNPGSSTWFFNMHFYKTTFTFLNMGYGSTLAWLLFLITLAVTLGLFYSARYWVYYASGDEF